VLIRKQRGGKEGGEFVLIRKQRGGKEGGEIMKIEKHDKYI
jgi:hypothetical protein